MTIALKPGAMVTGGLATEQGDSVDEALVISRLNLSPRELSWHGTSTSTLGGKFTLSGLDPDQDYPVSFLDPKQKLGATQIVRAGKRAIVLLKPCGEASATLVDSTGRPRAGVEPHLSIVVTPAAWPAANSKASAGIDSIVRKIAMPNEGQYDQAAARLGRLSADEGLLCHINKTNYGEEPKSDAQGRITFPALIPGATYRLHVWSPKGDKAPQQFSVKSGERLDLGTIDVGDETPAAAGVKTSAKAPGNPAVKQAAKPAQQETTAMNPQQTVITGKLTLADGKPAAAAHVAVIAIRNRLDPAGDPSSQIEVLANGAADASGNYRLVASGVSAEKYPQAHLIARKDGYALVWQQLNFDLHPPKHRSRFRPRN